MDDLFGLTGDYECFVSLYTGLGSTLFDIIVKLTLCVLYITRIQFDEVELYAWYVQLQMVLLLPGVGSVNYKYIYTYKYSGPLISLLSTTVKSMTCLLNVRSPQVIIG